MAVLRSCLCFTFTLLVLSSLFNDVDARRQILRGRKTITRQYYTESLLPAWAKVILIGGAILIGGVILYGVLYKFAISNLDD